jgi:hypothetical protein
MGTERSQKLRVVAWAPFFERAKFKYWKNVGRGTVTIGEDGKFEASDFYNDAHVSGGSIWTRLLPEGVTPKDQPDDAPEGPKRPSQPPADDEDEF